MKQFSSLLPNILVAAMLLLVSGKHAAAQDNCAGALPIPIPLAGYGTGTFNTAAFPISTATVQAGEFFAYAPLLSAKSIWYSLSLPTARFVNLQLNTVGIGNNSDVGFTCYRVATAGACLPGFPEMQASAFTPMQSAGSSTQIGCLPPGEFMIQVTANGTVTVGGTVSLAVTVQAPAGNAPYDFMATPMDLGVLPDFTAVPAALDIQCFGMELPAEVCAAQPQLTQSAWVTFTTPADLQWLLIRTGWAASYFDLFQGDIAMTAIGALTPTLTCAYGGGNIYPFLCNELLPNTTYTLHILYDQAFVGADGYSITAKTSPLTNAVQPTTAEVTAPNQFGMIVPSSLGATSTQSDVLACNAYLTNNACGTLNTVPAQFTTGSTDAYPLGCYFTFSLASAANVVIDANNIYTATPPVQMRLFGEGVTGACGSIALGTDMLAESGELMSYSCLAAGNYTVQVIGNVDSLNLDYYWSNMLGFPVDLSITATSLPNTLFGLNNAAAAESMIGLAPLLDDVLYTSTPDTFSCANSPLPDTFTCNPDETKAIYRQFRVGDADGDAVPDSGQMIIEAFTSSYYFNLLGTWHQSSAMLFEGNAQAEATAQNTFAWPQQFTGLTPETGCGMYTTLDQSGSWTVTYEGCHTPGVYTHAQFGDSILIGQETRPTYRFRKLDNQFFNPAAPENMGDVIANGLTLTSQYDRFTCTDNAVTIAGFDPCAPKAVYREFYLSQPAELWVSFENYPWHEAAGFRIFSGRGSLGLGTLSANVVDTNCVGYFFASECNPMPAGWYTVVAYGRGPNYTNNLAFHETSPYGYQNDSDIGNDHRIIVTADTSITPGPLYNRPYKACEANNGNPIALVNNGTAANPNYEQRFTLCTENFKLVVDTPLVGPAWSFCPDVSKVAYYVFTLAQESYIRIEGVEYMQQFVFPLDVTTDSLLLATTTPLTNCDNISNAVEICRLQPGTYTLVIGGDNSLQCTPRTPTLIVDRVLYSQYDFADHAYDFGMMPPDGVFHDGFPGDVNLVYPGAMPSGDMIYCTTGAFDTDPYGLGWGCGWPSSTSEVYPNTTNNTYYTDPGQQYLPSRNLWYTFATDGPGTLTVEVTSPTPLVNPNMPSAQPFFALHLSDENGATPFPTLVANGLVDSTAAQNLTALTSNHVGWCALSTELSYAFLDDACSAASSQRRFYVEVHGYQPNVMVEVRVRWTPYVNSTGAALYDHFAEANTIGSGLTTGPYPVVPLTPGNAYTGGWDNFFCATTATTDWDNGALPWCTQATLWYTFTLTQGARVFAGWQVEDSTYIDAYGNSMMFQELVPGDSSTTSGMLQHTYSEYGDVGTGFNTYGYCLEPGTYHFMMNTCNGDDTLFYRPYLWVFDNPGDHCANPHSMTVPGLGTYSLSGSVNCHTIGDDYGEDGSDMGCLPGPAGWQSTWFFFEYTGTDTVDVTFSYNNLSTAWGVGRRVFYGDDCTLFTAGECNTNFISQDVISCVDAASGSFFVQVLTPDGSTGNVEITLDIAPNTNPDCIVFDPNTVVAGFTYVKDCLSDSVIFINTSTSGTAITFDWDFGYGGLTSTDIDPHVLYPVLGGTQTYDVTLLATHTGNGQTSTITQTITFDFIRPVVELGADTTICASGTDPWVLDATQTDPAATYLWQDGSSGPTFDAIGTGQFFVEVTLGSCTVRDTIDLVIEPQPVVDLGLDITYCTATQHYLEVWNSGAASILWSDGSTGYDLYVDAPDTVWVQASNGQCVASDTIVINLVISGVSVVVDTAICNGFSYTLPDGNVVSADGSYPVTFLTVAGCDSTITTNLTVLAPLASVVDTTVCSGVCIDLPDGISACVDGSYISTIQNTAGCDSTVTTNLTVLAPLASVVDTTVCSGECIDLPDGVSACMDGSYTSTIQNAAGCDSTITTNLTVSPSIDTLVFAEICTGAIYFLPDGSPAPGPGLYTDTLTTAAGCDSIVTTDLSVVAVINASVNATICSGQSYTLPGGGVVSLDGIYSDTLTSVNGCDSVITTTLTVNAAIDTLVVVQICTGAIYFLPDGSPAPGPGLYTDTLTTAAGCDSIVTTDLSVVAVINASVNATICSGQSYTLPGGGVVSLDGIYSDTLTSVNGCDSVITTTLTVNAAIDTLVVVRSAPALRTSCLMDHQRRDLASTPIPSPPPPVATASSPST
ncbi:MAG: hypothetical protein IPO12_09025 [Flavobacteriales bacterium]|nr:hypothetical protein [Flavobacteriales bacterium]